MQHGSSPPGTHDRRVAVLDRFAGVGAEETFAIGDVHGRADLLDLALDAIAAHPPAEGRPRRLVTLGDYVDRGPEGMRALDILAGAQARLGFPVTSLLGNHEQLLLCVLADELPAPRRVGAAQLWVDNGGGAVIRELIDAGADMRPVTVPRIVDGVGPERAAFLRGLVRAYRPEGGDVAFVHAGLNPWIPLAEQLDYAWGVKLPTGDFDPDRDPSWVREPFLDHEPARNGAVGHHGAFIVHGHTPQDGLGVAFEEQVGRDRVNLDHYAVGTGRLRIARLVGNVLETFEVRGEPDPAWGGAEG